MNYTFPLGAFLFSLLLLFGVGCSGHRASDYQGVEPRFLLEEYFSGKTRGYGLVLGRGGEQKRRFTVDIEGTWSNNTLTLNEDFVFDDGETQKRIWKIEKRDDHTYVGRADDVVGDAIGISFGNVLNFSYVLKLKAKDSQWNIQFNDWMFLHEDEILINTADMTKFGLKVGQILLVFRKAEKIASNEADNNEP